MPFVHVPAPQSPLAPHTAPSEQDGEQVGATHLPLAQLPLQQSAPVVHADPAAAHESVVLLAAVQMPAHELPQH